jgi:hypothetical protein
LTRRKEPFRFQSPNSQRLPNKSRWSGAKRLMRKTQPVNSGVTHKNCVRIQNHKSLSNRSKAGCHQSWIEATEMLDLKSGRNLAPNRLLSSNPPFTSIKAKSEQSRSTIKSTLQTSTWIIAPKQAMKSRPLNLGRCNCCLCRCSLGSTSSKTSSYQSNSIHTKTWRSFR